jgi:hypothetical protein
MSCACTIWRNWNHEGQCNVAVGRGPSSSNGKGNEAGVMSGLTKIGIAWLGIVALLAAAPCSAGRSLVLPDGPFIEDMSRAIVPPPPPPPPIGATAAPEITPTLRAMYGQWRLVRRDDGLVPKKARFDFVLWGTMFLAQKGCLQASGQLIARTDGTVRIDRYPGMPRTSCKVTRIGPDVSPFDGPAARFAARGDELFAEASGKTYHFRRVITDTGRAGDDFLRGQWLLATLDGSPLRGTDKTMLSFDERGSTIDAAHCDYGSDGAYPAESYRIRLGGSYSMATLDCRASTIGDKWAKAPDAYELIAVPVEARMDLRRRGKRVATLVPAARFPELADSSKAVAADGWSTTLADHVNRLPRDQKLRTIGRILSINISALATGGEKAADTAVLRQLFAGYSDKETLDLAAKGLALPAPSNMGATVEEQALGAPIIVVAQLEGTPAVDRGDGLSLDYLYRVKESWRGDRKVGDVLVVRMPPLVDKSRSPFITPVIGTPVLLQASRSGYLTGRLLEGKPPSSDRRTVSMTLPIMRVEAGQLTLDLPSPDIPGAHVWRGLAQDQAKQRVTAIEARSKPIAAPRSHANRRIFVIAIDGKPLPNPTWLWFDFDDAKLVKKPGRASGDIIAWSDGCNVTEPFGDGRWMTTQIGCGQETTLPAMHELIGLIDREGVPGFDTLTSAGGPAFGPYLIPDIKTPNHSFQLREGLR